MKRPALALLAALLLSTAALAAGKTPFVYSATFPYQDVPKDLWPERLVRLKGMGFNTVQIPLPDGRGSVSGSGSASGSEARPAGSGLLDLLRLARQLGLHVWLDGGELTPELQPFAASRGGPILDDLPGGRLSWFPAEETQRRLLLPADFTALRRRLPKQGKPPPWIWAFDAGWTAGSDVRARPSDPSNYLLASRELLAAGVKGLNCSAVVEERTPSGREAALGIGGEARPQAVVLGRNGALLGGVGRLLAAMHPAEEQQAHLVLEPKQKPSPLLRLGLLVSPEPRGPAFLSALNYNDGRAVTGVLSVPDPRTGRRILVNGLNLPARQALLMPINLPLALPEVCPDCSRFAPDERLVWATAELVSVDFENGVLGMEFIAPAEAEMVLEMVSRPQGPLISGARIQQFDWDEKLHRLHLRIPAGPAPDFRSRVGLGVELPDTSVFIKAPRRFILGSTAEVTASFSSPELAARSRLLTPAGWRMKAEPGDPKEIEYRLDVPADAVAGDKVTLAVQVDGKIAQTADVPLAPFCGVRIEPEESLHPRRDTRFPIRPHLATLALPGRRTYTIYLKNNYDEIRTFEFSASGEGLRITPSRLEVSIGANLEREVTLTVGPEGSPPGPGLYRWKLEVRDGPRKIEEPLTLAVIGDGASLAYELDLDRDGFPELVLENRRLRAIFSPRQGGRSTEFWLKDQRLNAFTVRGALESSSALEGRVIGPGVIELRSAEGAANIVRRISLGGRDSFFEVEQTGDASEWTVSAASNIPSADPPGFVDEPSRSAFSIAAPQSRMEVERKPFSTLFRLRFPEEGPRRARFLFEHTEEKK